MFVISLKVRNTSYGRPLQLLAPGAKKPSYATGLSNKQRRKK